MGKHTVKRGEGSMYQDKKGYYTYKVYYIDIDNKKKRKGFEIDNGTQNTEFEKAIEKIKELLK